MIDNEEVLFRKILKSEAGIILRPLNDNDYKPDFYNNKEIEKLNIRIIGKPVELRRKLN